MARRRQARRSDSGIPGWLSFTAGLVLGLGLATVAWIGGYLPQSEPLPTATTNGRDEPPIADMGEPEEGRRYDFFQVLPEVEVVVPQAEIEERAREPETESTEPDEAGPYVLQVGSFQRAEDAESLKARLALLGMVARVQQVSVDEATYHRVRVGPYDSARETDEARQQLEEHGYEAMVLSGG